MCECEEIRRVGAYHDGELSEGEALRFEAHLARCPVCRRELEELRRLSGFLSTLGEPAPPAALLDELHRRAASLREEVVISMAARLTAAAAAVIVACTAWALGVRGRIETVPAAADGWEWTAVTLRTEFTDVQGLAQWMVENLSSENGND